MRLLRRGERYIVTSTVWPYELQWGRGFYAAERILGHRHDMIARTELQWGRGFYAAESIHATANSGGGISLQWGRGFYAAERYLER